MDKERTAVMVARLKELSYATADQRWREFSMRVPADTERDADLVLMRAAMLIEELSRDAARYRWLRTPQAGRETWVTTARHGYPLALLEEGALDAAIDDVMTKTPNVELTGAEGVRVE